MSKRTVGVIGGMGPAATVQFAARVQALTGAARDADHIRLIIDCNPFVPDRNAAVRGEGPSPGPTLAAMAVNLERAGAEILVMPCNAAHAFAGAITAAAKIPFIDLIEAACDEAAAGGGRIGVLAADGCLRAGLYQGALARRGLAAILPQDAAQADFMALLYQIKAGRTDETARAAMQGLARRLVAAGAETIVAGCTEIALVMAAEESPAPLVDSVDALARAAIAAARR